MAGTETTLVDVLYVVILFLITVLLESRFGVRKRVLMLWHKLVNSETYYKLTARYETDVALDSLTDELKSVLREIRGDVEVIEDHKHEAVIEVADSFLITLQETDAGVSLETSKLTSTMRAMRNEMRETLRILEAFETRNVNHAQNTDHTFEDREFTAALYLPYDSTFINTYLPRGTTISSYELALDYPQYECSIQDTGDAITVSTSHRADLTTILGRLLRVWTVWWQRLR